MDEGSLEQNRLKTKTTIQSWSETCGLAPEGVTDKLDAAMLDWMSDLTDSLDIWMAKSLDMTDGEFIESDGVEPLRTLFKDEVRAVGRELGLPDYLVNRQPFPGPGLGIRIIGEVTRERLDILRAADLIARQELTAAGLDQEIWQCPVVLLADVRSVGVQGDGRTYGHPIVLRPVSSEDAMTADWTRLPYDVLARISTRITNSVPEVNRVVLDVTSKPPATIEWE